MTELTESTSRHNYWCFLWHAGFLALASSFMRVIKREGRENRQLWNYLLVISTLGDVLGIMAFLVLYAKENFLPIILLYITAGLALSIPLLVIFSASYTLFMFTFFIGGVLSAVYIVSMDGILLEISTMKN